MVKYAAKKTELERYWDEANTVDQTLFCDDTLLAFVHNNNCCHSSQVQTN